MICSCSFLRRPLEHEHAACCAFGLRNYARTKDGHWHTRAGGELGWSSPRCIHCTLPLAVAYVAMTPAMVVLLRAWFALTGFATGKPRVEHWEGWT